MHATASGIQEPDHKQCTFVVFLCTTESLVGLLYAGMCAAIFFGRVARVQSHAQVTFSEGVCVEYGDLKNKLADNPDQVRIHSFLYHFILYFISLFINV